VTAFFPPDFEDRTLFQLMIDAVDSDGLRTNFTITITIRNVNEVRAACDSSVCMPACD
jgi:hypothetical protein